jgi:hypothetical protein
MSDLVLIKKYYMLSYFKKTGKYYTSGVITYDLPEGEYFFAAVEKTMKLIINSTMLPGLSSKTWPGLILLQECKPKDTTNADLNNVDGFIVDGLSHIFMIGI